ncbi:MAG: hypothetical protein QM529_07095 [Hydrotalea sp.]|nr:hypothetical protein [Hydrotalea sp.]
MEVIAKNKFLVWEQAINKKSNLLTDEKLTGDYILCLNYEKDYEPKIWVVEPDFIKLNDLPHVYKQAGNQLCLYKPENYHWSKKKNVREIITWAHQWLFYYEDWLINGHIWRGHEASHDGEQNQVVGKKNFQGKALNKTKKPEHLKNEPIRLKDKLSLSSEHKSFVNDQCHLADSQSRLQATEHHRPGG